MTERSILYLDYNIFEAYYKDETPGLRAAVDLARTTYVTPHSPAHLEDLATSFAWHKGDDSKIPKIIERTKARLINLTELTRFNAIMPSREHYPLRMIHEPPGACLMRVLNGFSANREIDQKELDRLKKFKANDPEGKRAEQASNLPIDFLSSPPYKPELESILNNDVVLMRLASEAGLENLKWPEISKSKNVLEHVIEVVMNYLEHVRFRPERVTAYRSHIHDVSHAIYGTKSHFFVTADRRFLDKVKATYSFLKIPTKAYPIEHLIAAPTNLN